MNRLLAIVCASVLASSVFFTPTAWALSVVEFLQLKPVDQMKVMEPIALGFLKAGYKNVPDNEMAIADAVKKLAFEKGYVYQNVEEVAKEAATRMGMKRGF